MARLFLSCFSEPKISGIFRRTKSLRGCVGCGIRTTHSLEGRRCRQRVGRSRKLAQSALKHIEVDIEKGRAGIVDEKQKIKPITVKEFFEKYLAYAETNLARSSVERYCSAIANFQHFLSGEKKQLA